LDWAKFSIFLFDEEEWGGVWAFGWTDVSLFGSVLLRIPDGGVRVVGDWPLLIWGLVHIEDFSWVFESDKGEAKGVCMVCVYEVFRGAAVH
jgi:hypothetical protein